jgi:hypothetical protein
MIRSKTAPYFARALTMGLLWALLALVLHVVPGPVGRVHAQGSRKDDIVFNSRGIPLAGATIRVCVMPATGQPCSPLAQLYSDAGLTQAISNPTTSDGLGNYSFYAAPGRYEIEISGPGITTKQLPNVILPSDPTSPTFSGAVSAFSLNLAGNLSVTGNTVVIGNLASGTLNLSNQTTPPGAAGAGTVNLYTKTADKRLYYKDETGTEIGPISSGGGGAQTNTINTFTAQQNFDADTHTKGPNPWFDITRYGGYSGATTPPTITCSTTSASTTMTCSGGVSDFAVGQGIAIPTAGPAATATVPGTAVPVISISVSSNVATISAAGMSIKNGTNGTIAGSSDSAFNGTFVMSNIGLGNQWTFPVTHANCSPCTIGSSATLAPPVAGQVTPQGILNGSTSYNYKIVAKDANGGLSAASAVFATATGAATLGVNNVSITQYQRASGVVTFTTSAAHNFQSGVEVNISYVSGTRDSSVEGAFTIASTPTSTTFTIYQLSAKDSAGAITINDNATVIAKNLVQWPMQAYTVVGSYIYRCTTSCGTNSNYTLVGVTEGMDGSFVDWGTIQGSNFLPSVLPAYVPANPPSSPTNGYLQATIANIVGTTVTLSAPAVASVSGATVLHDNVANIFAACNAGSFNGQGGTIYFPSSNPQGGIYPLSSPLLMTGCPFNTKLLLGAPLFVSELIIGRNGFQIEGLGQGSNGQVPSFVTNYTSLIEGNAYPFILLTPGSGSDNTFTNLSMLCNQRYQSCVVQDQDSTGNSVVSETYNNVYMQGHAGSQPFRMGGSFGFYFTYGGFVSAGATSWGFPPTFLDTVQQGLGLNGQQLAGIMYLDKTFLSGGEMLFDAGGITPLLAGPGHIEMKETLNESGYYPNIRFNTGNNPVANFVIINPTQADQLSGLQTPLIDAVNAQSLAGFQVKNPACNQGPLFSANPAVFADYYNAGFAGCNASGLANSITRTIGNANSQEQFQNVPVVASGANGTFSYLMQAPTAPTGTPVSGGTLPAGTYLYQIVPVDVNGNLGTISPASAGVTLSGSQQTSLSFTTVPGQVSSILCRSFNGGGFACATTGTAYKFTGNTFTDNLPSFNFSGTVPTTFFGASVGLGAAGIQSPQITLTGGGFASNLSGIFTATRTQALPDNSGYIPVTSYINSAYDNTTRANGALGANWTQQQSTLNVASNQIQGATLSASNAAFWNASPFSTTQFSQATITGLNGTSDFPGVTVMASGTGGGSTYYDCVENSTTIFVQRVVNTSTTNLTNTESTGAIGDLLRLEIGPAGALTCYKNGAVALTATDTTIVSGSPGLLISGNVATEKNWSGGNLHPLSQLDVEADYTKPQHLLANGGTCSMSAGTTCTITLAEQPASTTRCLVTQQGTGTVIAAECSISGTTLTITAASSNSATWAAFIF